MNNTVSADRWLTLQSGVDPAERTGTLRRAHEAFVRSGDVSAPVRDVVIESWRRSAGAGVDPDIDTAPIDLTDDDLETYRAAHPLARAMPVLRDVLGSISAVDDQLVAVSDAAGRLLWVDGQPGVLRRAESMNFVAGAWWDEPHIGTNAPGTAVVLDHAVQIIASEHFSRALRPWTCSAAPIHDPASGLLLGAVDISGGDQVANPHSLALVRAAARLAEASLGPAAARSWAGITFTALGRNAAIIGGYGKKVVLSRRHSDIVALLACRPDGLTGDQLGLELYGDDHNPVTLRAELSRLRLVLGAHLLGSRPYRLRAPVDADFLKVQRLLEAGALREALAVYRGPLLPDSDAPGLVQVRDQLTRDLRAAVLACPDVVLLDAWAHTSSGTDDLGVWEVLAQRLPARSARRALAISRVRDLRAEYGLPADPRSHATSLQPPGT
jgi:hypothetical protein